jgi:isopentenyl diphosphate isomerase/L-lactate dehydrogenase-like FMN-dependent dehydrogenase
MRSIINVEDLRQAARRRLPRVVFDYLDGGAEAEVTLRENPRAFEKIFFRPRQAVTFPEVDMRTTVLGSTLSLPAMLAPIGYSRLLHPEGERGAARAAGSAGTGYILSTISGYKLEDVKAATTGPAWYQLYLLAGREAAELVIERARVAGFAALVVTVDTPVAGMRERDFRNGMVPLISGSWISKVPYLPQMFLHPRWVSGYLLDGGIKPLPNVVIPGKGPMPLIDVGAALARTALKWDDFKWIREIWRGPIVVKGVLTGDDARRSIDAGASAVVVSNHGGRQLDGVRSGLHALPEVVTAVNGQIEVLMDGGIRRGGDIAKAICMGARAVLLGRGYAYGMAAAGEAGVRRAIEIIRNDLARTLKLLGCGAVKDLDASYIEKDL